MIRLKQGDSVRVKNDRTKVGIFRDVVKPYNSDTVLAHVHFEGNKGVSLVLYDTLKKV
jgi:hypothetical protein